MNCVVMDAMMSLPPDRGQAIVIAGTLDFERPRALSATLEVLTSRGAISDVRPCFRKMIRRPGVRSFRKKRAWLPCHHRILVETPSR